MSYTKFYLNWIKIKKSYWEPHLKTHNPNIGNFEIISVNYKIQLIITSRIMIQFVYKLKDNCTIVKRYLIRNFSSIYWEIKKLSKTASKNGISTGNSIYMIHSYKFSDWWRKIQICRKTGSKIKNLAALWRSQLAN